MANLIDREAFVRHIDARFFALSSTAEKGTSVPDFLLKCQSAATSAFGRGDTKGCVDALELVFAITVRMAGAGDEDVQNTVTRLAQCYLEVGSYSFAATSHYFKLQGLFEGGRRHDDSEVNILERLCDVAERSIKEKAEFVDAVDVYMDARQRILNLAVQQRKSVAVIDCANKLIAFCRTFAVERVIDIAYELANQSSAFLELDAHAKAAAAAEQAIAELSDAASAHEEILALALTNLGEAQLEQGNAAEAEPVLQNASALAEALFGSADDRTRRLHRRLAEIAIKRGDTANAKIHAFKSIKIGGVESHTVLVNPAGNSSGESRTISFTGDEAPDEDIANVLVDIWIKSFAERHDT